MDVKKKLEMDFVLEGDDRSMHILNAISPAFPARSHFQTTYAITSRRSAVAELSEVADWFKCYSDDLMAFSNNSGILGYYLHADVGEGDEPFDVLGDLFNRMTEKTYKG